MMTKLTVTQCVLLSTAAKRESVCLYPLPEGPHVHKLTNQGNIAVIRTLPDRRARNDHMS